MARGSRKKIAYEDYLPNMGLYGYGSYGYDS